MKRSPPRLSPDVSVCTMSVALQDLRNNVSVERCCPAVSLCIAHLTEQRGIQLEIGVTFSRRFGAGKHETNAADIKTGWSLRSVVFLFFLSALHAYVIRL